MLGSSGETGAVQETWLRLSRSNANGVQNLGGWLTTAVSRVCLDMLRSHRPRREEPLGQPPGGRVPETIVSRGDGIEGIALRRGFFYVGRGHGANERDAQASPHAGFRGGGGTISLIYIEDAAAIAVAALERGRLVRHTTWSTMSGHLGRVLRGAGQGFWHVSPGGPPLDIPICAVRRRRDAGHVPALQCRGQT
jgi:hypothetical protein